MKKYPTNESTDPKDKDGFSGDFKGEVRAAFPPGASKQSDETKLQMQAMIFAAFVSNEAKVHGRKIALNTTMPFDEVAHLNENKEYLFEHMADKIKDIKIYAKADKAVASIDGGE